MLSNYLSMVIYTNKEIYNNIVKSKAQSIEAKINQGNSIKISEQPQQQVVEKKGCC